MRINNWKNMEGKESNYIERGETNELPIKPETRAAILERANGEHVESDMPLEEAEHIQSTIDQVPEYQDYMNQRIRLDTIESIIDDFETQTEERKGNERVQAIHDYLLQTTKELRTNVELYYGSILRGQLLGRPMARLRMDSEKHRMAIETADQSRRNYHNGILAQLRSLSRNCRETLPREIGVHISEDKLFTDAELSEENRMDIGEWAYNTAVGEHLNKLLKKAQSVIEVKKTSRE